MLHCLIAVIVIVSGIGEGGEERIRLLKRRKKKYVKYYTIPCEDGDNYFFSL